MSALMGKGLATRDIGLTAETGRPYRSIAGLLEACSREGVAMAC